MTLEDVRRKLKAGKVSPEGIDAFSEEDLCKLTVFLEVPVALTSDVPYIDRPQQCKYTDEYTATCTVDVRKNVLLHNDEAPLSDKAVNSLIPSDVKALSNLLMGPPEAAPQHPYLKPLQPQRRPPLRVISA